MKTVYRFRSFGRAYYTSDVLRLSGQQARKRCQVLAAEHQISIEARLNGSWHEIILSAPVGMKLTGSNTHEAVIANAGPTTDGLWEAAERDLTHGLYKCTESDCEWCEDMRAEEN